MHKVSKRRQQNWSITKRTRTEREEEAEDNQWSWISSEKVNEIFC